MVKKESKSKKKKAVEAEAEADPVAAFAQQLGIRADEEDFQWLAEVGYQSPLPPRWTSHTDAHTGFLYYVDHDRQASSWENPLVPYLRRVVEIGRTYLEKPSETFFEEQKGILWHQHKHELDCWHGPFADPEGRTFYVNTTDSVSSWQDPRVSTQYIFELESGLLATLAEVLPPPSGLLEESDTPWKTENGAEVLTVEDNGDGDGNSDGDEEGTEGAVLKSKRTRGLTETMKNWSKNNKREEHKSALEQMANTAEWLRTAREDEQEVQRLQFSRKVEARRQRQQASARSETHPIAGQRLQRRAPPALHAAADSTSRPATAFASLCDTPLGSPSADAVGKMSFPVDGEEPQPPSPLGTELPPPPLLPHSEDSQSASLSGSPPPVSPPREQGPLSPTYPPTSDVVTDPAIGLWQVDKDDKHKLVTSLVEASVTN